MRTRLVPNEHGRQLLDQLRQLREKVGLTQQEAGRALGGSRYQIGRMENGRLPRHDELLAVLDVYRVAADQRASYLDLWEQAWRPDGRRIHRLGLGR